MKDVFGEALLDWHLGIREHKLWINNKYGDPEEMPIDYYFRDIDELPEIEGYALTLCEGHVLDVGAGSGVHSLILQQHGLEVDALEISANACKVLKERGVTSVLNQDVFELKVTHRYDTILILMNGLGIAQTIDGLKKLLNHLKTLLAPEGQILFDSSDVEYLFAGAEKPMDHYYGEMDYQYEYKGEKEKWFKWLFIDFDFVQEIASQAGYLVDFMAQDDDGHYLCRLTLKE